MSFSKTVEPFDNMPTVLLLVAPFTRNTLTCLVIQGNSKLDLQYYITRYSISNLLIKRVLALRLKRQ